MALRERTESFLGDVGPQHIPWRALARAEGERLVAEVKGIVFTAADHRTVKQNKILDQAQYGLDKKAREDNNRSIADGVRLPSTRGRQRVHIKGVPR